MRHLDESGASFYARPRRAGTASPAPPRLLWRSVCALCAALIGLSKQSKNLPTGEYKRDLFCFHLALLCFDVVVIIASLCDDAQQGGRNLAPQYVVYRGGVDLGLSSAPPLFLFWVCYLLLHKSAILLQYCCELRCVLAAPKYGQLWFCAPQHHDRLDRIDFPRPTDWSCRGSLRW